MLICNLYIQAECQISSTHNKLLKFTLLKISSNDNQDSSMDTFLHSGGNYYKGCEEHLPMMVRPHLGKRYDGSLHTTKISYRNNLDHNCDGTPRIHISSFRDGSDGRRKPFPIS